MFTVIYKKDEQEYQVYDIRYDKNGYPMFLIYKNNQWLTLSAKNFVHTEEYYSSCG